jgi:F420-dependent oxidoreductase-like protein
MKLGLQIPECSWPGGPSRLGATFADIARTADRCGFDSIGVDDHVFQGQYLGPVDSPKPECYTTLAFLAANTSRAKLIPTVTAATYRHPGMLAKIVTTLDVLSGGRAWLGIGAGYYEAEAGGLGLPFPPAKERLEMLEETLQICLQMWRGDEQPYRGKHFQLEQPINSPQSLTRPHPPILIGGSGEKTTLRLVARYADACNLVPTPDLPRKLEVLRAHCVEEGRDYDAIEKTCMFQRLDVGDDGSKVPEVVEQFRRLADVGIQTVITSVLNVDRITPLEIIGRDVIPAIASFGTQSRS